MFISKNSQQVLVILAIACVLLPGAVLKFGVYDKRKAITRLNQELVQFRENTASFSKITENPETVGNFIKTISLQKQFLTSLKPLPSKVIDAQQSLAEMAKETGVTIIVFKPSDEVPQVLEIEPKKVPAEGTEEVTEAPKQMIYFVVLELRLQGSYAALCNFLEKVENSKAVTLGTKKLTISKDIEEMSNKLDLQLTLDLFYS